MIQQIIQRLFWILVGSLFVNQALAQAPPSPINMLRYNDDFTTMKKDTARKSFGKLKYLPVGKNSYLSLGGELREQYQYFQHQNFGDVPPTFKKVSVGQLWHRAMVHANLELGSKVRIFVQLNNTLRLFNPNPLTPEIDENELSVHQAFIDYAPAKKWLLRIGKQELGYGNNRIFTFREGPNTRLSFNGAIIKYHNNKRKMDLLAITPVTSKEYAFDDVSFREYIIGFYATENIIPKHFLLDYYFLHFTSKDRKYNFVAGKENRQSIGLRLFSQNPRFNYELESTYQWGRFNDLTINAAGFSLDVNYKLARKTNFIIGVGANYFTGDKNSRDGQLNTYNLIYSKPSYGLAAPIGSSNIENLNPYIKINPIKKLSVYAGTYLMKRQRSTDGTYSPGMAQVRPNPTNLFASTQRTIGSQYAFETTYTLSQHFSFALDAAYFKAGSYVKETGKGLDILYVSFKSTFKF